MSYPARAEGLVNRTNKEFNSWPETDLPWSRLHIDFTGLLNGSYYLIVVDSFFTFSEVLGCKKPIKKVVIGFLNKIFIRFVVPNSNFYIKNSRDSVNMFV